MAIANPKYGGDQNRFSHPFILQSIRDKSSRADDLCVVCSVNILVSVVIGSSICTAVFIGKHPHTLHTPLAFMLVSYLPLSLPVSLYLSLSCTSLSLTVSLRLSFFTCLSFPVSFLHHSLLSCLSLRLSFFTLLSFPHLSVPLYPVSPFTCLSPHLSNFLLASVLACLPIEPVSLSFLSLSLYLEQW